MPSSERRAEPRINLHVPLRFRPLNNPGSPVQMAESVNVSRRGIFFVSAAPLAVGAHVELQFKMPGEFGGQSGSEAKCSARVVHVEPDAFLGGKAGVGLHIERYETMQAVDRWAS